MRKWLLSLLTAGFFAYTGLVQAIDPWAPKLSTKETSSDHGGVGLWQMPTARMAPDGEFAVQMSRVEHYDRYSFALQALKNFEFVFRYNSINNQLYGPKEFSGDLTYKDRGFDAKLALVDETDWWPAVAVGARDFLGTGLFSSEYVVASKRFQNWDMTGGLMWGNIGSRRDIRNPLSMLSSRFDQGRETVWGQENSANWFKGKHASLFAGVSYQLPNQPLWLMAEYDANNYKKEPFGESFSTTSPVNVGVKYRYNDWLDLGLSYQRGDTIGFNIGIRTNFMDKSAPIPKMEPPVQPTAQANILPVIERFQNQKVSMPEAAANDPNLVQLSQLLSKAGVSILGLSWQPQNQTLRVLLHNQRHRSFSRAIGRASRVLIAHTDARVLAFHFSLVSADGLATDELKLMRHQLIQVINKQLSPTVISRYAERLPATDLNEAATFVEPSADSKPMTPSSLVMTRAYPDWSASLSPAMRHNIGGPNDFYQFQVMLVVPIELRLRPGLSLSTSFTANVYNTFDKLTLESNSRLPKVRSDIKHYLQQQGAVSLTSFQADYMTQVGAHSYARASAGLFEEMFGGVGGEYLYAPAGKRWALGVDAYWVKQRDFDQKFAFRDYQANTGHATWYHQWPWLGIFSKLSVGQYLAGDRGYTIDVSRMFDNGVTVGGFFTRTNVSAAEFGEGSFDKGIYISVPLDFLTTKYTRNSLGMVWKPLTRDGGAILGTRKQLYPTVMSGRADDVFNGAIDMAD